MKDERIFVKKLIQRKFGSLRRFCLLAGLDTDKLTRQLKGERKFTEKDALQLKGLIGRTQNRPIVGYEITDEARSRLKDAILFHDDSVDVRGKRSVSEFSRNNPEFPVAWISRLTTTTGKYRNVKITEKARKLAQKVGVKLDI